MNSESPFKISYVGGGSRFVVTFPHSLAAYADAPRALGRRLELVLLDLDSERAGEMARYAEITRQAANLPLAVSVTDDHPTELEGSETLSFAPAK